MTREADDLIAQLRRVRRLGDDARKAAIELVAVEFGKAPNATVATVLCAAYVAHIVESGGDIEAALLGVQILWPDTRDMIVTTKGGDA
jgi:hypothetical protein